MILAGLIVAALPACSQVSKSGVPGPTYEVIDRSAVVLEEVSAYPTTFLSNEPVNILWHRTTMLASEYINTSARPSILEQPNVRGFHLRHFPAAVNTEDRYGYEIIARAVDLGTGQLNIRVDVIDLTTRARNERSTILAKNIARFLETGTLERKLLNP
jgi:hypothetical protein